MGRVAEKIREEFLMHELVRLIGAYSFRRMSFGPMSAQ
jgi:hypothetical protein